MKIPQGEEQSLVGKPEKSGIEQVGTDKPLDRQQWLRRGSRTPERVGAE